MIQIIQSFISPLNGYIYNRVEVRKMTEKNAAAKSEEKPDTNQDQDKKKLQEEFLKTVDSKLKKEEKDIWFVKNNDHLKT